MTKGPNLWLADDTMDKLINNKNVILYYLSTL